MNKRNLFLGQTVSMVGYGALQLLVKFLLPYPWNGCFVYIGFFMLQPWQKKRLIAHLVLAFLLGLLIDILYNCPGVHTFSAVLLMYCRHHLLYLLLSSAFPSPRRAIQPHPSTMGIPSFFLYIFIVVALYYGSVSTLVMSTDGRCFMSLSQLMAQIVASWLLIGAPIGLLLLIKH
jgi:hypothetical protein